MVQVMRRYIAFVVMGAVVAASLGCRHVAGRCDCGYNPADYPINPPTNPYPAAPAAVPNGPPLVKPVPPKIAPSDQE
jgi:hypothetical protein